MAITPYEATKKLSGKRWPTRVGPAAGYGEGGTSGEIIASHPLYRHPLEKLKSTKKPLTGKWKGGGGVDMTASELQDLGMTEQQWRTLRFGETPTDYMFEGEAIAGVDPTTGKWKGVTGDETYGIGGKHGGIKGAARRGNVWTGTGGGHWEGVYKGGGYGFPSWAKGWYEPAREASVDRPLEQAAGEEWKTLEEATGGMLPATDSPYTLETEGGEPISADELAGIDIQRDVSSQVGGVLGTASEIERVHGEKVEELFGEGGEFQKEREGLATRRQEFLRDQVPTFERQQAVRAGTGMAYSGPAEAAIAHGKRTQAGGLAEIGKAERELGIQEEAAASDVWQAYAGAGGALRDYWSGVETLFGQASEAATGVATIGEDILTAWTNLGGMAGSPISTSGEFYKDVPGPFGFTEQATTSYEPLEGFRGRAGTASDIARSIADRAGERRLAFESGQSEMVSPDYVGGGYGE